MKLNISIERLFIICNNQRDPQLCGIGPENPKNFPDQENPCAQMGRREFEDLLCGLKV